MRSCETLYRFLPPVLVGLGLRLGNLRDQVLGGDELHTVRFALEHSAWTNFTTFRDRDPCLPLTGLYRLLMDAGVELSEILLRLPMLLTGLVFVFAIPSALSQKRWCTRREATILAWLLAVSPLLVFYSRIVRPYMPVVLLAWIAALSFYDWLEGRSLASALTYVITAPMAVYFHLLVAPFVLAPVGVAALKNLGDRSHETVVRWRSLALVAVGTTAGLALFLGPSSASLWELVRSKRGPESLGLGTLEGASLLFAGVTIPWAALLFWAVAAWGLSKALGDPGRRRLTLYLLTLAIVQLVAILVLGPYGGHLPPQFSRYHLPLLPAVLLWVAIAVAGESSPRRRPRRLVPIVFLTLMVLAGPLAQRQLQATSFAHHKDYAGFYAPPATIDPDDVPTFYKKLAERRAEEPLLEAPWHVQWALSRSAYVYQALHGRRVLTAPPDTYAADPRMRLRNTVAIDPAAILASPARFLIVHLDWIGEQEAIRGDLRSPDNWEARKQLYRGDHRREGARLAAELRARWGPPLTADGRIEVWDLREVRRRR